MERGDLLPRRGFGGVGGGDNTALAAATALVRLTALPNDDAPSAAIFAALTQRGGARWLTGELAACRSDVAMALSSLMANLAMRSPLRAAALFDAGAVNALAKHICMCRMNAERSVAAECALRTIAAELKRAPRYDALRQDAELKVWLNTMLSLHTDPTTDPGTLAADAAACCAADVVAALFHGAEAELQVSFLSVAVCCMKLSCAKIRQNPIGYATSVFSGKRTRLDTSLREALGALRKAEPFIEEYLEKTVLPPFPPECATS